jgi:hypothetical protein
MNIFSSSAGAIRRAVPKPMVFGLLPWGDRAKDAAHCPTVRTGF